MTPAKFDTVAVDFVVGGPGNVFRATGQTMTFAGFYAVYHEDLDDAVEEEDKRLPPSPPATSVRIEKLYGEQHFTQPPPRYSEASLVKALEQYGIGRPRPMPRSSRRSRTASTCCSTRSASRPRTWGGS
jgi:DNA topoisomerase-1